MSARFPTLSVTFPCRITHMTPPAAPESAMTDNAAICRNSGSLHAHRGGAYTVRPGHPHTAQCLICAVVDGQAGGDLGKRGPQAARKPCQPLVSDNGGQCAHNAMIVVGRGLRRQPCPHKVQRVSLATMHSCCQYLIAISSCACLR